MSVWCSTLYWPTLDAFHQREIFSAPETLLFWADNWVSLSSFLSQSLANPTNLTCGSAPLYPLCSRSHRTLLCLIDQLFQTRSRNTYTILLSTRDILTWSKLPTHIQSWTDTYPRVITKRNFSDPPRETSMIVLVRFTNWAWILSAGGGGGILIRKKNLSVGGESMWSNTFALDCENIDGINSQGSRRQFQIKTGLLGRRISNTVDLRKSK